MTTRRIQLAVKRLLDVSVCAILLVIAAPVLAVIALLVRLSSPGPIFFVQERTGLGGKPFRILKFRTMTQNQSGAQSLVWSSDDEARVTRIGSFLRDYGLDELPQLINIIRGDMSIIGPRPPLAEQAAKYTRRQRESFTMRPGVLSLAGVKGRRAIPLKRRVELHVEYVRNWSLWLDFRILALSATVVFGRKDATERPSPIWDASRQGNHQLRKAR